METISERFDPRPDHDDFTRTGAVWVTGTGAFLVVVAAAVFVAVRWDQLSGALKLGILGALCGASLLAGKTLRRRLPATGAVLYHLGAFLIPVVAAAVALRFDASWSDLLLVEGITGAVAFTALERAERSAVLRIAAGIAVAVAAVGLGGTANVPPAATLAMAAVVAELARRRNLAMSWALIAAVLPVATVALEGWLSPDLRDALASGRPGGGLVDLGSAVVAAVVLFAEARRRRDLTLLLASTASVVLGGTLAWVDVEPSASTAWLTAALVFVGLEASTRWFADDDFLGAPLSFLTGAAELVAGGVAICLAVPLLVLPDVALWAANPAFDPTLVAATVIAAAGWLVADVRRRQGDVHDAAIDLLVGSGWLPATIGLIATLVAGVGLGTASAVVMAVTMTMLAVALVVSGRAYGHALAIWLSIAAVAAAHQTPALAAAGALVGALSIAGAAVVRARRLRADDPEHAAVLAWSTAAAAVLPPFLALILVDGWVTEPRALVAWIATCWVIALMLDRGARRAFTPSFGVVGRAAATTGVGLAIAVDAPTTAMLAMLVTTASVVDARRRRDTTDVLPAVAAAPVAVIAGVLAMGGTAASAAVACGGLALAATIVSTVVRRDWAVPALATAGWALALAALFGAGNDAAFATVLLMAGGCSLAIALDRRSPTFGLIGATSLCLGIWSHLDAADIDATDAYVAPVALALLVVGGLDRRRRGLSSWIAYAPGLALFGVAAIAERLAGGPAAHSVVALLVGTVAVAVGGWRRLAAPLLVGTALVVAVAVTETFAYTATMPTWAWLGLAGAALVAAGIAMERAEVGPVETGRRVVDVVRDRFA